MRILRLLLTLALLAPGAGLATAAGAEDLTLRPIPFPVCEGPISTCRTGPIRLDAKHPDLAPSILSDDCPKGYACECVPSCPGCKDCDAQVCLPDPTRECKTACDCAPGLGCFEGQCLAGIAPVYCCDSNLCPVGELCQDRDGVHDRCEVDPTCYERAAKASAGVRELVKRGSSCREDTDCARIDTSTMCGGTCGAFVNRRYADRISRAIDHLDKRICDGYREDGCPFAIPGCLATRPACVRGRCEGVPILPGPIPDPHPLEEVTIPGGPGAVQELEARR